MAATSQSKRKSTSPARVRYWANRRLEKKKVCNLMRSRGLSKEDALRYWLHGSTVKGKEGQGKRTGRVPEGFFGRRVA